MTDATRFYERVHMPRWLLITMALPAIAAAVAAALAYLREGALAPAIALAGASVLLAAFAYAMRWFEVSIDRRAMTYRWAGFPRGRVNLAEIVEVAVVPYPYFRYGGWGWRVGFGLRSVAYSVPFKRRALSVRTSRGFVRRRDFTLERCEEAREVLAYVSGLEREEPR